MELELELVMVCGLDGGGGGKGGVWGSGGRTHLLLALVLWPFIEHGSLSRRSAVPTPSRGTYNMWALIRLPRGGGGGVLICCLPCSPLAIDHGSLAKQKPVPTPNRDTYNIWALITLLPYIS